MNFIRNRNFRAGPQTSLEGFICPQNSDKQQKIKVFGRSEGGVETDKNTTIFDEDYEYYAHFALVNTDGGKVKAICSWGGFYDYYASQSSQEQEAFLRDLESKKYPRLLYLLTQSEYRFEKVNGIGGFSIETDIDYTNDIDAMAKAVAKAFNIQDSTFNILVSAAVEIWKGTRLLVWRQLLQRYVLLHKVPVIDQL